MYPSTPPCFLALEKDSCAWVLSAYQDTGPTDTARRPLYTIR
jgi:pyrimidine deaminase RibD-like protein